MVTIDRKDGFAGPIEVDAVDLPAGVSASPVTSRVGDASAKTVTLKLVGDGWRQSRPVPGRRQGDGWPTAAALGPCGDRGVRGKDGSALAHDPPTKGRRR